MKSEDEAEIVERIKASATELRQLKRDCGVAGLSPMDTLDVEEAAMILEHLVGRLSQQPR